MHTRIFIYEDNSARRESLKNLISLNSDFVFVGEASNCENIETEMDEYEPNVVLMDINMPIVDGIEGLKLIRTNFPNIKVIIQTIFEDNEKVFECLKNGACGYILKKDSGDKILAAIEEVANGGASMSASIAIKVMEYFHQSNEQAVNPLTQRETEVLKYLAEGLSYKMIGDKLCIKYHTVNTHIKNIYEKLHVASMGEAIAYYYKNLQ